MNLGAAAAQQGKNSQAKLSFQECLVLARKIGHREQICRVLINLGDVFVEEGNYTQAEVHLQEGLALARQLGHREWMSVLLINLAMSARKQDHNGEAKQYLQESLTLANQISQPRIMCVILCELGNLLLAEGNASSAGEYFQKLLKQIPLGDQELLALVYYGLARVCVLQGDMENARLYADKSVAIFEAMEHRKTAEVRYWMKSVLRGAKEIEKEI
jgi:tetratricopeptide (TPR) repeat protein